MTQGKIYSLKSKKNVNIKNIKEQITGKCDKTMKLFSRKHLVSILKYYCGQGPEKYLRSIRTYIEKTHQNLNLDIKL